MVLFILFREVRSFRLVLQNVFNCVVMVVIFYFSIYVAKCERKMDCWQIFAFSK